MCITFIFNYTESNYFVVYFLLTFVLQSFFSSPVLTLSWSTTLFAAAFWQNLSAGSHVLQERRQHLEHPEEMHRHGEDRCRLRVNRSHDQHRCLETFRRLIWTRAEQAELFYQSLRFFEQAAVDFSSVQFVGRKLLMSKKRLVLLAMLIMCVYICF